MIDTNQGNIELLSSLTKTFNYIFKGGKFSFEKM